MKSYSKLWILLFVSVLLAGSVFYLLYKNGDEKIKRVNFYKQLGIYRLDVTQTDLGIYSKDITRYRNLCIMFKEDNTFCMNMRVPFFFDSIGKWNAAGSGLEEWNWLYYKKWDYSKYDENTGDQFTSPWTSDSIFYINGATPEKGNTGIQRIFFKKLKAGTFSLTDTNGQCCQ